MIEVFKMVGGWENVEYRQFFYGCESLQHKRAQLAFVCFTK